MVAQVIELIDEQVLFGQQVLNVFHYVDTTGVADPAVLVSDYINDVLPLVQGLQTTQLSHTAIRSRKVFPTADLVQETPIVPSIDGVETGDPLASCDAASGKWLLTAGTVNLVGGTLPHIKRGGVRIAGMVEGNVVGNSVVSGYTTAWAAWVAELLDPGTDAFLLCVASFLNASRVRQKTVQQYALVGGGSAPSPSTQNTRKVLRGRSF